TRAIAVTAVVDWDDVESWLATAFEQLRGQLHAAPLEPAGPDGALYSSQFFERHLGEITAFVPVAEQRAPADIAIVELPGTRYAVARHTGPFDELDRTYAALGTYVAERMIGSDGPIRENY